MFEPGQRVGIAVSGGADSVCLLRVLLELQPRWNWHFSVLHVEHGLRGEESSLDAEFVRGLAEIHGLPFFLRHADLSQARNVEEAARLCRREFFLEFLARGELDRIALGHTQSDQAETVLFRFLRGSGTAGLAGIRPVTSDGIVRPLIAVEREEIRGYLRAHGIAWREDSSNEDLSMARNRIRRETLPALASQWNPALMHTLAQVAEWALAEEAYWDGEVDRYARELLQSRPPAILLSAARLTDLHPALARRLIRRAICLTRGDLRSIEFDHVEQILELARVTEGSGRLQIPKVDVMRSFDWLRFAPPPPPGGGMRDFSMPLPQGGSVALPVGLIRTEVAEKSVPNLPAESRYNETVSCLDWNRASGHLEIRNWRPGDQYQPLGHTGPEKIKTLFQRARVPLWERRSWPVVVCGGEVVWARRFGPAAAWVAGESAGKILFIHDREV
jgi:tRNA(Ile)-lysidine synthase